MWWSYSVTLTVTLAVALLTMTAGCQAQQRVRQQSQAQSQAQGGSGEQQIRLEDIERDNLAGQKTAQQPTSQQPAQQQQQTQQPLSQQQLAAFQQQLLLQQLQQQYFAPTPIAYGNIGGVPLMIIPSNQLGPGGPLQAYFVPADPAYFPPYTPQVFPASPVPYHAQRVASPVPVQRLPSQELYNTVQIQPSVQTYRQPQNYPSASVVYPGSLSQPQAYQAQQQQSQQQLYNAYNALYQQRQEKNTFGAGVKSTPAPPLKPQSQVYSQQSVSPSFATYKSFNYNQ